MSKVVVQIVQSGDYRAAQPPQVGSLDLIIDPDRLALGHIDLTGDRIDPGQVMIQCYLLRCHIAPSYELQPAKP